MLRWYLPCQRWLFRPRYFSSNSSHQMRPDSLLKSKSTGSFYESIRDEQIKNKRHLLMVRVGDFYEFYFNDALKVAPVLGFKMAQTTYRQQPVVFCGFPIYKLNEYVKLLLEKGFSIAKFEQYQQTQPNGQSVMLRRVDRIYTQGTLVEDDFVSSESTNHVLALFYDTNRSEYVGFSCIDLLSGEFIADECMVRELNFKLAAVQPKEILTFNISDAISEQLVSVKSTGCLITDCSSDTPRDLIEIEGGEIFRKIFKPQDTYSNKLAREKILHFRDGSLSFLAACLLLRYIVGTHYGSLPLLNYPTLFNKEIMQIDAETQRSLEIIRAVRGSGKKGSLFHLIDSTVTVAGSRELLKRLCSPSTSISLINERLDGVEYFVYHRRIRDTIRSTLANLCKYDASKALQNLRLGYGGPWHVKTIHNLIKGANDVKEHLKGTAFVDRLRHSNHDHNKLSELQELLHITLPEDTECQKSLSKSGSNVELQRAYSYYQTCLKQKEILGFQLQKDIAISNDRKIILEGKGTLGPYVEIEHVDGELLPAVLENLGLVHLQTLGGSKKTKRRRYRYESWSKLYYSINAAQEAFHAVEREAFKHLCDQIYEHRDSLLDTIDFLAEVDVATSLAQKAEQLNYVKPIMCDQPLTIIKQGRHPVVEYFLNSELHRFTPNDLNLGVENSKDDDDLVQIITASNMAGKSTYLRQNALISVMAQTGSFVPATSAKLGIVDKLFARIGASDDIAKNQSTFMVEMSETAHILINATCRSLVIMDEVGRGTSPEDGLSLAYGIIRYLLQITQCRTIFATHFHELVDDIRKDTELKNIQYSQICTYLKEGQLFFTHEVVPGVAYDSHGIDVARLAGIPKKAIKLAENYKLLRQAFRQNKV